MQNMYTLRNCINSVYVLFYFSKYHRADEMDDYGIYQTIPPLRHGSYHKDPAYYQTLRRPTSELYMYPNEPNQYESIKLQVDSGCGLKLVQYTGEMERQILPVQNCSRVSLPLNT